METIKEIYMDENERERIAEEILELTATPEDERLPGESTMAELRAIAEKQGKTMTTRQIVNRLERAVREGKLLRRKVGSRVYYRKAE